MSNHEIGLRGWGSFSFPLTTVRVVCVVLVLLWCATGMAVAPDKESDSHLRTAAEIRELIDLGRYPQAEVAARELLIAAESEQGTSSRAAADARDLLVAALIVNSRAREPATRELAEQAVSIRSNIGDSDSLTTAEGLMNLGVVLRENGEFDEAEDALRLALEIREHALGPNHIDVARTLNHLGTVANRTRSLDAAEADYGRALAILEAGAGREHPECAVSLSGLGASMYLRRRAAEAQEYLAEARAIRERVLGPDHPLVAENLRVLALVERRTGDYEEAEDLLRRALEILEESLGEDHPRTAWVLNSLANQVKRRGNFAEARRLYERALAIFEASMGPWSPWVSGILNNLASVHRELGDFAMAEDCLRRALAIREHRYGADHETVAQSLNNLASVLIEAERYAEAIPPLQRAITIKARVYGRESVEYAISLASLGRVYRNTGDLGGAEQSIGEAIAILEAHLGPDHPEVASQLNNLALVMHQKGDLAAARAGFQEATGIFRATLGEASPRVGRALYNLARVEADDGRPEEAVDLALQAEALGRAHLQLVARGLAEGEALGFDQYTRNRLDLLLAFALRWPRYSTKVWDTLIRSRSLVLDELVRRRRVMDTDDPELATLLDELTAAADQLAKLSIRGPGSASTEGYLEALASAQREVERLERALGEASSAFRHDQLHSQIGFDEVVAALPQASALVGITRRAVFSDPIGTANPKAHDYVAMVFAPGMAAPKPVVLGSAPEIDSLVAAWRQTAVKVGKVTATHSAEEAAHRRAGEALRRRLWDPLAPLVEDAKIVFVVPDGELGLVNLAALPTGGFEYLVETGPLLHILDEERDLVSSGGGVGLDDQAVLLAVGDPDFDWKKGRTDGSEGTPAAPELRGVSGPCGSLDGVVFRRLPSTGPETEKIVSLWRRCSNPNEPTEASSPCRRTAVRLTGSEATEAEFKRLAPGATVLHLATHGFVLGGRCEVGSAKGCGIGGLTSSRPSPPQTQDPIIGPLGLAGLALAGANHRAEAGPDEEDGVITAAEIANLDLSGVEWAVLSACDSGVGESVSGEGVFGFRRAFRIAGAHTVIMSLWPVEDTCGQAWMESLYRARLRLGMTTAESVRHASLELLHDHRDRGLSTHPFHWGAFVAAGDWR